MNIGRGVLKRSVPLVGAALLVGGCDFGVWLTQADLFGGIREGLIEDCCACLATSGTRFPGAACAEAVLAEDGEIRVPADAGPAIPVDAPFDGDDLDRVVEEDEVPCLCGEAADQCVHALTGGEFLVVTGACISQGDELQRRAPCQEECRGVLAFDPLTTQQ